MINRGLLQKAACEIWLSTFSLCLLAAFFETILAYVLPSFSSQFTEAIDRLPFVQTLISAMLGVDTSEGLLASSFVALGWVHPVVVAVVFAHATITSTRIPAGEIDRGTIDILLGWPVSRWEVFFNETIAWKFSGVLLCASALGGNLLGRSMVATELHAPLSSLLIVTLNLYLLYASAGTVGYLVSSWSSRRGVAMGIVFAFLVSTFLLNYLAQLWKPANDLVFLSLMHYYQPMEIVNGGEVPWLDLATLAGISVVCWSSAGWIFSRRDICTI